MAFLPNPRNKEYVTHKDSDYWNNVVSNLQWVSNIERVEKAKTLGAFNRIRQDRKPGVELTVFDLYQIVKLLKSSEETHDQIALRFNVSTDTISRIKNNKVQKWATWRNILGI
jgi:DNA invertase Pin-like site-specific DNA recombinase